MSATGKQKHLYLIDGSAYIFRAFHALPPMTRSDGTPINAVYGFTNMMLKLIEDALEDEAADYLAVIFDFSGKSFRNEIFDQYKANRPPAPEELVPQIPLTRDATRALGVPSIEIEHFEADDIIATYARQAARDGARVTIVSSDKDLMQLVGDGIEMLDPMKNRRIGPDQVREKFGVGPERVVDVQALAGDSTDNVPGVPGIGVKTAAQLIEEYGDLEAVLERASEIKQPKRRENLINHAEDARVSLRLVTLRDDVPTEETIDDMALKAPDPETLVAFLEAQEFRSLAARFSGRHSGAEAAGQVAAAAPADAEYVLVQDEAELERWIERAEERGRVAFDTETSSLDAVAAELIGLSLSVHPGEACYVPVGHAAPGSGELDLDGSAADAPKQIPRDRVLELLRPLLGNPAVLKIGQNIKYDMLVLRKYGVDITPIDDTMVLSYVLDAGLHGHGLDEITEMHVGHTNIKYAEVAGSGRNQIPFAQVSLEAARDYAAEDADVTGRLHDILKPRLVAEHMVTVYETLDRPLVPVLVDMEATGVKVDVGTLRALSKDFAGRMGDLEERAYTQAGGEFNLGSPRQLGEILFDRMGLEGGRKTKSGGYGTGADVLEGLAAQGHELPQTVLDWRQLSKLKSTYTDALVEQINPDTGRVHTSYGLTIASTGRLSSTDPNLQNIPVRTEEGRKIRNAFIADEGMKLVSLDYSQIELRLLAHVADMEKLKEAFRDGMDIHATTASEVFGVPVEGMDPMIRRQAKAINFGIIYGISAFGLARQLGISRSEAGEYIDAYFERYPGIRDYMDATKQFAHQHGHVRTPFGRRIHLRGINSKNPAEKSFSERAAINAPLQGGAADIIKRAMIRVPDALTAANLSARMLLQVHDELLFEVPEKEVEETVAVVREVMENAAHPVVELSVPLVVAAGIGDNWADAH